MTREQLLAEIAKRSASYARGDNDCNTPEAQLRWFVSYQRALEIRELSVKELARVLDGNGIRQTNDAGIDSWLSQWDEDTVGDLIYMLDKFYPQPDGSRTESAV